MGTLYLFRQYVPSPCRIQNRCGRAGKSLIRSVACPLLFFFKQMLFRPNGFDANCVFDQADLIPLVEAVYLPALGIRGSATSVLGVWCVMKRRASQPVQMLSGLADFEGERSA
jgi:hypothetical protein